MLKEMLAAKQYVSIQSKTAQMEKNGFDNNGKFQHFGESDE